MPGSGRFHTFEGVNPAWSMIGGVLLLGTVLSGRIAGSDTGLDDPRGASLTNNENTVVFGLHGDEVTVLGPPGEVDG